MSDGRTTILINATPPSLNRWLSKNWRVRHSDKKKWEEELYFEFVRAKLPRSERIDAEIYMRFNDNRKRDCDNHVATISKMLGDALQIAHLPNDDSLHFWVRNAQIEKTKGPALTTIILDWTKQKPD